MNENWATKKRASWKNETKRKKKQNKQNQAGGAKIFEPAREHRHNSSSCDEFHYTRYYFRYNMTKPVHYFRMTISKKILVAR